MILSFLNPNEAYLKEKRKTVSQINQKEEEYKNLSQEEIKDKIKQLQELALQKGDLNQLLVDVFALTKIASERTLKQRHFDVQLLGGIALHEGKVVEMKTGEGKTLVATLPAVLNALTKKGVHIITVNDYLAKRDTVWMGQIYDYLGLTTSCITQDGAFMYDPLYSNDESSLEEKDKIRDEIGSFHIEKSFLRPCTKKEAYEADITYGTNTEFGFDYLRDNLVSSLDEKVQRSHYYAIIDEVDSVLIDEARTPLIISTPDEEAPKLYQQFASLAHQFIKDQDFTVDEKLRTVSLTEEGLDKAEKIFGFNIFDEKGTILVHYLITSLQAEYLYLKDKDYIVKDGKVIIVDEFTGRLLPDRRLSINPENTPYLNKLKKEVLEGDLSPAALETLSIIAYRGPISRAEINEIRGVDSSYILRQLFLRELIERFPSPQRQNIFLYQVSFKFLEHLGLTKVQDLPNYEELHQKISNL